MNGALPKRTYVRRGLLFRNKQNGKVYRVSEYTYDWVAFVPRYLVPRGTPAHWVNREFIDLYWEPITAREANKLGRKGGRR